MTKKKIVSSILIALLVIFTILMFVQSIHLRELEIVEQKNNMGFYDPNIHMNYARYVGMCLCASQSVLSLLLSVIFSIFTFVKEK